MRLATSVLAALITLLLVSLATGQSGEGEGASTGGGAVAGGGVDATGTASAGNRIAPPQTPQTGLRSQFPFTGQNRSTNGHNTAGAGAGPNSQRGPTAANNPPGFTGTTPFATGQGASSPAGGKNSAGVATGLNPQNTANAGGPGYGAGAAAAGASAGINGSSNQPAVRTTAPAGGAAPLQGVGPHGTDQYPRKSVMAAEQRALQQRQQLNNNRQLQPNDDRSASWRFKQHNGEWWHYGTGNAWQYHRNGAWNRYDEANFTYPAGYRALGAPAADDGVRRDIDPYDKHTLRRGSKALRGPLN